jgi:hypothetical protein
MIKRYGPLLVSLTGAALVALELFRGGEDGVSVFWIIVGALAIVLGLAGHFQRA